jgi:hypothetical protein
VLVGQILRYCILFSKPFLVYVVIKEKRKALRKRRTPYTYEFKVMPLTCHFETLSAFNVSNVTNKTYKLSVYLNFYKVPNDYRGPLTEPQGYIFTRGD